MKGIRIFLETVFNENKGNFLEIIREVKPANVSINNAGWIYFEYNHNNVIQPFKGYFYIIQSNFKGIKIRFHKVEDNYRDKHLIDIKSIEGIDYKYLERFTLNYIKNLVKEFNNGNCS